MRDICVNSLIYNKAFKSLQKDRQWFNYTCRFIQAAAQIILRLMTKVQREIYLFASVFKTICQEMCASQWQQHFERLQVHLIAAAER